MKNIEGILNRVEEDRRINSVIQKVHKIVEKKRKQISALREKIRDILKESHLVEQLKNAIKEKIKEIKLDQVSHYYSVLERGLDARQEGMMWVI